MVISVLIVDDEQLIRETLMNHVQWSQLGVDTVLEAEDGKRALEIVKTSPPDIIMSDIKMPHMNGIQLAQIIKDSFPDIRFVILSGYADKEYLKEAIHLHLDAYIEKPINLEEVSAIMRTLATECHRKNGKQPQSLRFEQGEQDTALNKRVFVLTQALLQRIETSLKGSDKQAALREIEEFCSVLRTCEEAEQAYMRNAYLQLVLMIQSAAAEHNAQETCDLCIRFSNETMRVARADSMEAEIIRIAERMFTEQEERKLDPVKLVNDYIQKNYADNDMSIDKLARDLGFNTSYLCAVYKQQTNSTINNTLTAVRIEMACKLLCSTDMKLYEVAARVGYSSSKYFTRVFMKEKGMSPKIYRRIHSA